MKAAAAGLSALVLLVGCATPAPVEPTPAPGDRTAVAVVSAGAVVSTPVAVVAVDPRAGQPPPGVVVIVPTLRPNTLASPVTLPLSIVAGRSGADVRVALNALLQEQVYLAAAAMEASSTARLDELIGASNALDQNSLAFAQVIGAVKGQSAAYALADAWRAQTNAIVQLTSGAADVDGHTAEIASQLALGDFSSSSVEDLLRQRALAFRDVAEAVASHDPLAVTARTQSMAADSDRLARPLAAAIASQLPAQAPPPTEGRDIDVRLALARGLLARVYVLGAGLAAAGSGRQADLQAQAAAADANASDLAEQLSVVWTADTSLSTGERLRAENAAVLSIASGGDRRAAAAKVEQSRGDLDRALSSANPLLPPGLLGQQLRASDQPLLTAADAFAGRDFVSAYTRLREAARQTQKPATTLALSIVDRYPARYLVLPTPLPAE